MADDIEIDLDDLERRMDGAMTALRQEFLTLRTGRASASMLEPIMVDAYGSMMPLNQVATVSVPESRMLSVQVWDRSMAAAVEKAIRESSLGLNPMAEGQIIRGPLPELNEERRRELSKVAHQYAEQARVAVRHVRRDGIELLRKLEKDGDMGQDDARTETDRVQKATDDAIAEIDQLVGAKEQEIMHV